MDKVEKIEELGKEIDKRSRVPRSFKKYLENEIFQNLIVAVLLSFYFLIIDILFFKLNGASFEGVLKYFALIMIFVTVALFEIAYKKDSRKIMFYGIECLISGILTLYVPFIFLYTNKAVKIIFILLPAIYSFYYILKSVILYKGKEIKYVSDNMSDVKEILEFDEKESYIDEKSEKTYRKKQEHEKEIKKLIEKEQKLKKENRIKERKKYD